MTARWGWIATGGIAAALAADLHDVEGAVPLAVASRSGLARAREFADEHGFDRAYGSYAELVADPDVDVVYVATPHAQHAEAAVAAARAGKAVLVEKPLTSSAEASRALVGVVRAEGVFSMEAVWTRFQPLVVKLGELLADGVIGDVRTVTAELGFRAEGAGGPGGSGAVSAAGAGAPHSRLWDPAQGGGGLLDLGVYAVWLAQLAFDGYGADGLARPDVVAAGSLSATGVDAEVSMLLRYPGGRQALLSTSLVAQSAGGAHLIGTGGWIEVGPPIYRPSRIVVHRDGAEPQVIEAASLGEGVSRSYAPQLAHVQECLAAGLLESPVVPLDGSLVVADVLEAALVQLGATRSAEATAGGSR